VLSFNALVKLEGKGSKRLMAIVLVLLILQSTVIPQPLARSIDSVDEEVKKYLLSGETITEKRSLKFGDVELIVYYLSSGHYIIYSRSHESVVLGDDWMTIPNADDLALQLISLLAFDKHKPLEKDFDEVHSYLSLTLYWNQSYVTGLQLYEREKWKIIFINIGTGIVLAVLVPPAGVIGWALLIAKCTLDLVSDLNKLQEKFKLSPEKNPKLFWALALMLSYDDEALGELQNIIAKTTDEKFKELIENIRKGIDFLDKSSDLIEYYFMVSYATAAANPDLLKEIESLVGGLLLRNTGAYLLFRNSQDPVGYFTEFSRLSSGLWSGQLQPDYLNTFVQYYALRSLRKIAIGSMISAIKDYIVSLNDDLTTFLGLHTSHSLLARELFNIMHHKLLKLLNNEEIPTLDNVLFFLYLKYLLYTILIEYCEGILSLSDNTLGKMYSELLKLWGLTNANEIRNNFENMLKGYKKEYDSIIAKMIIYTSLVYGEFDKYRIDMARRRGGKEPTEGGINVFLVIDVSGSMTDQFKGARKIDAAKQAAKSFVSLISKNDRVGLVKFSTIAQLVSNLTGNRSVLYEAIDRLEPGGSTAIGDGLWLALDHLTAVTGVRAVILLTDGMHNAGTHTPEEAADRARSLGVRVYTLGFGEKKDIDEDRMRKVAEMTGGQYFYSPSPEDLQRLYIILSQRIIGLATERVIVDRIRVGEVKEVSATVSAGTPYLGVKLSYSGSKLSVELVSPSGYKLSFYESNVVYTEDIGYISVSVYNPEVGDWKIYVRGVEAPQQGLEYRMVLLKPSITTNVDRLDLKLGVGESKEVVVKLKAAMDLHSLKVSVVGNVKDVVASVEPQEILSVKEGQEIPVRIKFAAPPSPSLWLYSGGLLATVATSRVYIPISVAFDALFAVATLNVTRLKPGRAFMVVVRAFNIEGKAVKGASTTATVGGKVHLLEDRGDGSYATVITGLDAGVHKIDINVVKEGYLPFTYPLRLTVILLGDINLDWKVDYRDIAILTSAYGSMIGQPEYNYDTDINEDGTVDYKDLAILIANYGKKV